MEETSFCKRLFTFFLKRSLVKKKKYLQMQPTGFWTVRHSVIVFMYHHNFALPVQDLWSFLSKQCPNFRGSKVTGQFIDEQCHGQVKPVPWSPHYKLHKYSEMTTGVGLVFESV